MNLYCLFMYSNLNKILFTLIVDSILRNGSKFYDFPFLSVGDEALPQLGVLLLERIFSTRSNFFPLRVDSH